jgi:EAL domain-containing protein (putative c-di-GMP-specific phosphodiesterase class I)
MAKELSLSVVAEGVELEEQVEFLREQGCDQIQGFIFSKPLPPEEVEDILLSKSQNYIYSNA